MSKFTILFLVLLNYYTEQSFAIILRGARASAGQFPWLIQFQTIAPCGGILVSPDWVLTAAQCVQYKRNSITLYAAGLNGTGSRQTLGVKATYIFPQYKAYSPTHDHEHNIALLKLVKPFDMCNEKIELLDLAPVRLNNDYKTCLIFGWQSYVAPSTKVLAKPIQYGHVLLNSWKLCMYMLKGNISYNNVFCAMIESENGMKACAGNPGSPIVCEDQYQRMILFGIASWSNFSLECGGIPTYLGVSVFRSWMHDLIFNDKKTQESFIDGKSTSKDICGHDRYLGSIVSATNTWNYSDLMESEHRRVDINEKQIATGVWKSLESEGSEGESGEAISLSKIQDILPKVENHHRINDYSEISSIYRIPYDIIRGRDDNLKQYHEVGQGKETPNRINDIGQKVQDKYNKDLGKDWRIELEDEFDDLDFAGSLDGDYFIGKSNSLQSESREGIVSNLLFLVSFFNCILIVFL